MQELATNKKLRDLLLNPVKNKENKSRLLKIFKQFKIKSDRKGTNKFAKRIYLPTNLISRCEIKNVPFQLNLQKYFIAHMMRKIQVNIR